MADATLVYYTANVVAEPFAWRVRQYLVKHCADTPIVSVSQKPIEFGTNVCVGEIGASPYNVYRQILAGAHAAKTKWIICCEDDTLYPPEHIRTPPPSDGAFCYNTQRWWIESSGVFRWRDRAAMCACVVDREFAIRVLEERFAKFPEPLPGRQSWRIFGEPGRCEHKLGLPAVPLIRYKTTSAVVTFNHRDSLGGKRRTADTDNLADELPLWGDAVELWAEMHG